MNWLIGIATFLAGSAAGALLFKIYRSDEAKVKQLETRLQELGEEHENYKSSVHSHFNNTARLLNDMTESYRNVYQHMATGARTLCPDYISSQLNLSTEAKALLDSDSTGANSGTIGFNVTAPPLDYAARPGADKKGSLDEAYGIEKPGDY
jgi:uncharacterized membrane-anchored protein YhcB (DUF1043 family)